MKYRSWQYLYIKSFLFNLHWIQVNEGQPWIAYWLLQENVRFFFSNSCDPSRQTDIHVNWLQETIDIHFEILRRYNNSTLLPNSNSDQVKTDKRFRQIKDQVRELSAVKEAYLYRPRIEQIYRFTNFVRSDPSAGLTVGAEAATA